MVPAGKEKDKSRPKYFSPICSPFPFPSPVMASAAECPVRQIRLPEVFDGKLSRQLIIFLFGQHKESSAIRAQHSVKTKPFG